MICWHFLGVDDAEPIYSIDELAERGGVSRRTVRYYVQRGLLPAPLGVGRGKHYAESHLRTLVAIREWQEAEVSLEDIHARLHGTAQPSMEEAHADELPQQETWSRLAVAEGVELHVRGRRLSEVQRAAVKRAIMGALSTGEGGGHG